MGTEDTGIYRFRLAVSWAAFLSFPVLAVTGFAPLLLFSEAVGGYWLLVHVAAGGVFVVGLAGLSTAEAHRNRFPVDGTTEPLAVTMRKACFWISLLASVAALVPMAAGMFQLSSASGQERLMGVHRYGGALVVITGVLYAYLAFGERPTSE